MAQFALLVRANKLDDTRIEFSGPGKPELTDEDG